MEKTNNYYRRKFEALLVKRGYKKKEAAQAMGWKESTFYSAFNRSINVPNWVRAIVDFEEMPEKKL